MKRAPFFETISRAYSGKGKCVAILSGNTSDLYGVESTQGKRRYLPLEQTLYQELSAQMTLVRVDPARGIFFYTEEDRREVIKVCEISDQIITSTIDKIGNVEHEIGNCQHQPLATLVVLSTISEAYWRVRTSSKDKKPLCIVMQHGGAMLPTGELARLADHDRQRLVTFLNMVTNPCFSQGDSLVLLVNETVSELNGRILSLHQSEVIELPLPDRDEREQFVGNFLQEGDREVTFEDGKEKFVEACAGLKLTGVQDLLEVAHRGGESLTRAHVLEEVNARLKAELGNVIKIVRPDHTPADIIGYEGVGEVMTEIMDDCEDPQTAPQVLIVNGANGNGKTFQMEGYANASGRVVIEIGNVRSSDFGGTDRLFERLNLLAGTFGKIMIMMDEAHTQLASIHGRDTHDTDKRLSGKVIAMMSNPRLRGKILWVMMSSRPDLLDPDIKSRASEQIPIFDLEGEQRREFVTALFSRKGLGSEIPELEEVMEATKHFSNRDYANLVGKVLGRRKRQSDATPLQVLRRWRASSSIVRDRRLQSLIAAQHCSYPELLPEEFRKMEPGELQAEIDRLMVMRS